MTMYHSIVGLDARYTLSQEFITFVAAKWVVRFNGKFIAFAENRVDAEELARIHFILLLELH